MMIPFGESKDFFMNENLIENYLNQLPNDQKEPLSRLIKLMEEKLSRGF